MANKYMNIDIIPFLENQMEINTKHYQSDFEIDKEMINKFARSNKDEDKTLIWMSRTNGTHCFKEADAFIRDTSAHNTIKFFAHQSGEPIVAFTAELIGIENGRVKGNLYETDFLSLANEIEEKSVNPSEAVKVFEDGYVDHVAFDRSSYGYYSSLVEKHGSIIESLTVPTEKEHHAYILAEQKAERNKMKEAELPKQSLADKIQAASARTTGFCISSDTIKKEKEPEI